MEILPGEGVALVKVGETRDVVEARLGPPMHAGISARAVYDTEPTLVVDYDGDTVELVELGFSADGGEQATLEGVQLTYRFMDDVLDELISLGHRPEPFDIGYTFPSGFTIFSMGYRSATDLDPSASPDDPRPVVEGVGIAPAEYWLGPAEESASR
ncbi:hypothetical protein ACWT_2179 [Actinoplanes sp. SE50]|uniref:hypothetical protein n=1 Tax=unclassified Actinoplanes TaxID=2626549 RepID=UPI00023ECC61|nr:MULTISPECIES: hypothetical protein [unclassified Actinoplanes]AEV83199.1 hypothetical protein ACPL_2304 [Actinoplanes sp. SE50/110]ATO81594.1 hypothetical protein ACWT_2179 [Actinoplanes sp. SE50]SLL99002.1 hypothetical protein ACSP50_2230 [Actinoplanes sp. SE50/110]